MLLIAQPIYASNQEIANKLKLYNNPSQNRYIESKLKPESKKQPSQPKKHRQQNRQQDEIQFLKKQLHQRHRHKSQRYKLLRLLQKL